MLLYDANKNVSSLLRDDCCAQFIDIVIDIDRD